jgi:hypothetical protein
MNAEQERLAAHAKRTANWKRWGPYLSERQWATVREERLVLRRTGAVSGDGFLANPVPSSTKPIARTTAPDVGKVD